MAVEAYAALVSLMNVLTRIQYSCPVSFDQSQIQTLSDQVISLVNFLEAYSQIISNALAEKMVSAAFAAENTIESNIVGRLIGDSDQGYAVLCSDLENAQQEMNLILQEAMEVKEKTSSYDQLPRSVVSVSLSVPSNETIKMEGFEEQVNHLIGHLTSRESSRQILPVVGMGGIGKTTLARSVYKKYKSLRYHFDIIAWVTVSQVFTAASIIRPLLRDIIGEKVDVVKEEELGVTLHKCLFNRRYFVILDDIWEVKAWDVISRFLPDNNDRSRILLTTRLLDVARAVGSCDSYAMNLLDDDKSWDLLSKKVFRQEVCPPELEVCGKRIAMGCKGLPLALVVIGGLLKASNITLEYWDFVARNISSIIRGEDNERCLEILSWSYHQLPIHLKPCFLYMATFPEDNQIEVSVIIKLWVADGFLKPNAGELPEEIAKKYLNDLIDRNLITLGKLDPFGNMESLTMHDLVRELSVSEAQKGGFIHVKGDSPDTIENQRRLVVHDGHEFSLFGKRSACSLICFSTSYSPSDVSCSRLLRVFSASSKQNVPEGFVQLVNLRFLRFSFGVFPFQLFSLIFLLWNLETLIMDHYAVGLQIILPLCDIWKLRHIKHLIALCPAIITLPDPPTSEFVLEKLETLNVEVQDLSDKVLKSIPNIKHLKINNVRVPIPNMVHCHKLEILEIRAATINLKTQMFPDSIRKLDLRYCWIPWGSMTLIGSLPNLEFLIIEWQGFKGKEWTTSEGEFQSLKYLKICDCDLVSWRTEDCSHFPSLEHLELMDMPELEEIPEVFGESMTLKSIKLSGSNSSGVVRSAKRILEEQQSNGNYEFIHLVEDYKSTGCVVN